MKDLVNDKLFKLLNSRTYITEQDKKEPCLLCSAKLVEEHPSYFRNHMLSTHQATDDVVSEKYLVQETPVVEIKDGWSYGEMCFLCGSTFNEKESLRVHLIQGHRAKDLLAPEDKGETGTASPPGVGMPEQLQGMEGLMNGEAE
jgi:hypothetical protein